MRAALALLVCCGGFAQTAGPQFDVASIKPSGPIENGHFVGYRGGPGTEDPGRYTCTYCDLGMLVESAYEIPYYRLSSTNRLPETRFHVVATVPEGSTPEQFHQMLRNLLADRFQLAVHRETREMETLRLVVAASGLKLKPYVEGEPAIIEDEKSFRTRAPGFYYRVQGRTMRDFADLMSGQLGKPVTDATGLNGKYDFDVWWSVDLDTRSTTDAPTPEAAIRSLGLKLEPRKGPVEFIIVDHAEKMPSEN
jgi:uncharacterized protein (TIGR03435 family)